MRSLLAFCVIIALAACGASARRSAMEGRARGYFISPNGQPFRFDGGVAHARWFAAADVDSMVA